MSETAAERFVRVYSGDGGRGNELAEALGDIRTITAELRVAQADPEVEYVQVSLTWDTRDGWTVEVEAGGVVDGVPWENSAHGGTLEEAIHHALTDDTP